MPLPPALTSSNSIYFLALNHMPGVGPATVTRLLKQWPDMKLLFDMPFPDLIAAGISAQMAESIANFNLNTLEEDLRWSEAPNHHLIIRDTADYPPLLSEIYDPPIVLYAKGDLSAFNKPSIAMVGTRKPSITGSENAIYFAKTLAENQVTIVSGLAAGIDGFVHEGCLKGNGQTIAVMGTGIERIYPARHTNLASRIIENGLIISEFPLKTPPMAGHFPRRNRIISGLSLATLIIEAAIRSGSLITARFAMEQNRDVWAIPGSIHNPYSRGCHLLIQQGARLITNVTEILETLQIETILAKTLEVSEHPKLAKGNLIQYIGFEITTVDQLILRSQQSIEKVTCELAMLELQGQIKAVSGGYMRCKYER